jgi:hypothetical protein
MNRIPVVCLSCHTTYAHIEVSRDVHQGESVGGMCPSCMKPVDDRLFSRPPVSLTSVPLTLTAEEMR